MVTQIVDWAWFVPLSSEGIALTSLRKRLKEPNSIALSRFVPTSSDSEESDAASEPVKETDEIWETAERETSSDVSASAPDKEGARIVVVVCPTFLRLPPVVPDSSTLVVVVFLWNKGPLVITPTVIATAITTAATAPSFKAVVHLMIGQPAVDGFPMFGSTLSLGLVSEADVVHSARLLVSVAEFETPGDVVTEATGAGEERDEDDPFRH